MMFRGESQMKSLIERHGLNQLPPEERVQLALELWESLSNQEAIGSFSDADIAEFQRRLEEHENDPTLSSTWEEVLERVRKQIS